MGQILIASSAWAQTITAEVGSTGSLVNLEDNTYLINGGTQAGSNLFHSFETFGLGAGETAHFVTPADIQNVLGRVTGGDASVINGLLQLSGSQANLYLINPAGVIFGADAQLNLPANFVTTTATGIGFSDGLFDATGANDYTQLTGSPNTFVFNTATGPILNQADLAVAAGQSLWLVGNSVLSTGTLSAPGGNVTVAAVPGERQIRISQDGAALSLVVEAVTVNDVADFTPIGAIDLATYLTGGEAAAVDTLTLAADGSIVLSTGDTFQAGTVAVGEIQAEAIDLMASQQVIPIDPALIEGRSTIVVFPEHTDDPLAYTFIDQRVDDPKALLYGGSQGTIATIIVREEDGIVAVTNALNDFAETGQQLDAINIVAEGNEGYFWLGDTLVKDATLETYHAQLQQWREALGPGADLLLYSCFTALGLDGEAFVAQLANVTGVDVAASVDATGSDQYDGNWNLEYRTGEVEANRPFSNTTLESWEGKLATQLVTNLDNTGAGSLRERIQTDAAAGDLITFNVSGTITLAGTTSGIDGEITWTTDDLTLDGNSNITLDGGRNSGIFNISANNATIQNTTLQNGSSADGGSINHAGAGTLALEGSTISNNLASDRGGGIFSSGDITLVSSTISGNSSTDNGGGIYARNGTISLTDSMVLNNSSNRYGGGISSRSAITVVNSTVSGNSSHRNGAGIYSRSGNITVTDSTVSNNASNRHGGGIWARSRTITLNNSTVSGNSARLSAAGTYSRDIIVSDSVISGNSAGDLGGGLYATANTTVTNSTISGNSATDKGGGIYARNNITIEMSTLSGNTSNNGGGIYHRGGGTVTLTNSTVSGNAAHNRGGGIFGRGRGGGTINLINSTVAFNHADASGGGLFRNAGSFNVFNSIIANNTATSSGSDVSGNLNTVEYSLIQDTAGITGIVLTDGIDGNIIGLDPHLAALANNGGSTQTHALRTGSPALDSGSNILAASLTTDQREETRFYNIVDMGAYEFIPVTTTATTDVATTTTSDINYQENQIEPLVVCSTVPLVEIEREDVAPNTNVEESAVRVPNSSDAQTEACSSGK